MSWLSRLAIAMALTMRPGFWRDIWPDGFADVHSRTNVPSRHDNRRWCQKKCSSSGENNEKAICPFGAWFSLRDILCVDGSAFRDGVQLRA